MHVTLGYKGRIKLKKLFVLFVLLASSFAQAPVKYFSAITTIDNPIYGPVAQLMATTSVLHLDKITISVDPSDTAINKRNLEFAIVFVSAAQSGYIQQGIAPSGFDTVGMPTTAVFSTQPCEFPCTPQYTGVSLAAIERHYLNKMHPNYIEDFTRPGSGDIPASKGVAIYTWQVDPATGNYLGWLGDLSITIRYHE